MCPDDVRIGPWVKPFHALKRGVRPSYGWEPVLFRGGRNNDRFDECLSDLCTKRRALLREAREAAARSGEDT